jgi:hypothetical protein
MVWLDKHVEAVINWIAMQNLVKDVKLYEKIHIWYLFFLYIHYGR